MKNDRRSIFVLLAVIVAVLVLIYLNGYMRDSINNAEDGFAGLGVAIAISASQPFMIALGLGAVFGAVGWLFVLRWAALVAGILFAVAMILLPAWFVFALIPTVLAFIGYARMKRP